MRRHIFSVFLVALVGAVLQSGPVFGQSSSYPYFEDDPFDVEPHAIIEQKATLTDPIYRFNRKMFRFNDRFYFRVLKPAAVGFKRVAPMPVRKSIRNFFMNLYEPVYFVNSLLQARPKDAGISLTRFVVNSTLGICGLFDPAKQKMEPVRRTFDQTFTKWGIKPGFYIAWPLIGPCSVRGTFSMAGEKAMDPFNYGGVGLGFASSVGEITNETTFQIGAYEDIKKYSVDGYSAFKDIYEKKIHKKARE